MRSLQDAAADSMAKAKGKLRGRPAGPARAKAEANEEELEVDNDPDEETIILPSVRADGQPGTPRDSVSARKEEAKPKKKKGSATEVKEVNRPPVISAEGKILDQAGGSKIRVIGSEDMAAYDGGEDGEVRAPRPQAEQAADLSDAGDDEELTKKQNSMLKKSAVFLKGAQIVSVEIDLKMGTTVSLTVIPEGSKKKVEIELEVLGTGQAFLKVPR